MNLPDKGTKYAPHRDECGATAVSVALLLTTLLAVMAFVMDTGYLYLKKNEYQNGMEAAALAGVRQLCDGNWEEVTRQVAEANGVPSDGASLTVETGYYDELDEFSNDLGVYRDFGPPPSGRYINAVHVRLEKSLPSLTGMNGSATVAAEAVAYLKRIDMASLDPEGFIHLGHNSIWEDTTFFANGDILWPQEATAKVSGKTVTYQPPEFDNSLVLAAGEVASCPVEVSNVGWTGQQKMNISWASGSPQSAGYIRTGMDSLTEIRPVDEETLDYWRDRADIIYTPDQAGQDNVFYGQWVGSGIYYIDPASPSGSDRRIIFFDAGEGAQGTVVVGPIPYSTEDNPHTANGYTIAGLTLIATCPIRIINITNHLSVQTLHIGGEENDQAVFISSGDIEVASSGSGLIFDGAIFRTGNDFILQEQATGSNQMQHIRVIADGRIQGKGYTAYKSGSDCGMYLYNNSQFGPPCPPGMARLGLLEPGG